jgi:hypothetical protein
MSDHDVVRHTPINIDGSAGLRDRRHRFGLADHLGNLCLDIEQVGVLDPRIAVAARLSHHERQEAMA